MNIGVLTTIVALFVFLGLLPQTVLATTVGSPCCPPGYTIDTATRRCLNNTNLTFCQGFGDAVCGAIPLIPWCDRTTLTQSCVNASNGWAAAGQAGATTACINMVVSILGGLLGNLAGNAVCPGIVSSLSPVTGAASTPTQCALPLACDFRQATPTCQDANWFNLYPPVRGSCPDVAPSGPGSLGERYISTAIGCINVTGNSTISQLLSWAVGVAGGISVLIILVAAFQITSAQGDAKRVKAGQELLTAALAGLFLIVLSVVLLNFLGVNVLGLQSLGFSF